MNIALDASELIKELATDKEMVSADMEKVTALCDEKGAIIREFSSFYRAIVETWDEDRLTYRNINRLNLLITMSVL